MASFVFKKKPIPEMFLGVDDITPEYECSPSGNRLSGIWVYIGGTAHYFGCDQYTICNPVEAREDGRRQAFNLVREIMEMTGSERREAFGKVLLIEILRDATNDDLAKKLDDWKKEKEMIRVRDEVYSYAYEESFVVTKMFFPSGGEDATVNGLKKDGTAVKGILLHNLKKTGIHVDDLDAYLEA